MFYLFLFFYGWYDINIPYNELINFNLKSETFINKNIQRIFIDNNNYNQFKQYQKNKVPNFIDLNKNLLNQNSYLIITNKDWNSNISSNLYFLYSGFYFLENPSFNLLSILKNDNKVQKIEKMNPISFSTRFSISYTESNSENIIFQNGYLTSPLLLKNYNLTGQGEIIGLIDSGIDYQNCWFHDSNIPLIPGIINESHRKIVYYDPWKDSTDYKPGHGTHTAAILAGESFGNDLSKLYNGISHSSKIYFLDIGLSTQSSVLYDNFNKLNFIKNLQKFNGGIVSNSWGAQEEYLHSLTILYDTLSFDYPNILWIFASGNHYSLNSIDTPSSSKNVLSIGASDAPIGNKLSSSLNLRVSNGTLEIPIYSTSWSTNLWKQMHKDEIPLYNLNSTYFSFISNINYCLEVKNSIQNKKRIVFIKGRNLNECDLTDLISVFETNEYDFDIISNFSSFTLYPVVLDDPIPLTRADFSSGGPSIHGLLKPDLIAPGVVNSIKSFGSDTTSRNCNFSSIGDFSGTSESTPLVAGSASIIRQYFREGFYPTGEKNSSNSFIPSSTLIRAMLINSAKYINENSPSFNNGFGQVNLFSTL